ncbi:MAG: DUF1598 domain-containing protein [Pirellulaceae bacterium]|nr:DUF1598 domain-containing protein [Pirellulaceae bacterium]
MKMPAVVLRAVRGLVAVTASCALLATCFLTADVRAQDSTSSASGSAANPITESTSRPGMPGAAGGGVMQDWTTVMMLISQTVDPDEWRDFGGTGNSTMIPYPNGVWLDAKGHLKRMERSGLMPAFAANARQPWRAGSGLRTVSLKALDAALGMATARGLEPTSQMMQLAGISHIQYVAIDKANRDVLIAGPAAKHHDNGFLLEDLRTLAALMNDHTSPLGCSLDPDNQGILNAQQFLSDPAVIGRLGRTPQLVAEQLKAKVGPHAVNVFGIDAASSTALALVDADEHMKRVGLGLASTRPKIKTYFDHLDRQGKAQPQSLIRWWFAYNTSAINVNAAGDLFELPQQTVAVMSEQQWVNAQGDRQATGANDLAADAFAKEMTEKLSELSATEPAYARLQGIFEIGLALQLAIESSDQPSLAEWFPNLAYRSTTKQTSTDGRQTPKSVEGVTAWNRLRSGTVVAVISGGVKIEPSTVASRANWQSTNPIRRPTALDASPVLSGVSTQWWWD